MNTKAFISITIFLTTMGYSALSEASTKYWNSVNFDLSNEFTGTAVFNGVASQIENLGDNWGDGPLSFGWEVSGKFKINPNEFELSSVSSKTGVAYGIAMTRSDGPLTIPQFVQVKAAQEKFGGYKIYRAV